MMPLSQRGTAASHLDDPHPAGFTSYLFPAEMYRYTVSSYFHPLFQKRRRLPGTSFFLCKALADSMQSFCVSLLCTSDSCSTNTPGRLHNVLESTGLLIQKVRIFKACAASRSPSSGLPCCCSFPCMAKSSIVPAAASMPCVRFFMSCCSGPRSS